MGVTKSRRQISFWLSALSTLAGVLTVTSLAADAAPRSASVLRDVASTSDESVARAVAARFKHPVIVDTLTTATEETSVLPGGSMQLIGSSLPVRVQRAGGWVAVDTTLERDHDGFASPRAATTQVKFSLGGRGPIAKVQSSSGGWVSLDWNGGALPAPRLDVESALYPDVFPGVDLRLSSVNTGMTEVLIIKNAKGAADPHLASVVFSVSGAKNKHADGGSVTTSLQDGSNLFSNAPLWWDASGGGTADGPGPMSTGSPVPATVTDSSISLDAAKPASSPSVMYPVYVDPTTQGWAGTDQAHTYVDTYDPSTSHWNVPDSANPLHPGSMRVGHIDGSVGDGTTHTARSYWQMNVSGVVGKHILRATFSAMEVWSFNCVKTEVDLYQAAPISSATTWNAQPAGQGLLAKTSAAFGWNGAGSTCATPNNVGFDITGNPGGNGVAAFAAVGYGSMVVMMRAPGETSNAYWKVFKAAATLTVEFNTPPAAPSNVFMTSGCNVSSGLRPGAVLRPGNQVVSGSGRYKLLMQGDGNLVEYDTSTGDPGTAVWSTGTWPHDGLVPGAYAELQTDGHFIVFDADYNALWISRTWGNPDAQLVVQDDGNLVIYKTSTGASLWASGPRVAQPVGTQSTSPVFTCFTATSNPTLTATGLDVDPGSNPALEFELWQYQAGGGLTRVLQTPTPIQPTAAGVAVTWNPGTLSDGTYLFRARAWDGYDYGPYPVYFQSFVVDTTVPQLPTVSWSGLTPHVGKPITVTFGPGHGSTSAGTDSPVAAYAYWWTSTASTGGTTTVVPVNPPGCNGQENGVWTVCPAAPGTTMTATVAPPDLTSTLWVAAMNRAGTYSQSSSPPVLGSPSTQIAGANLAIPANSDLASSSAGHGWSADWTAYDGTIPGIKDSAVASASPQGLRFVYSVGQVAETIPAVTLIKNGLVVPSSTLNQPDGHEYSETNSHILDPKQSFSVSGWVKPSFQNESQWPHQAVIAQDRDSNYGFFLEYFRVYDNQGNFVRKWRFCTAPNASGAFDCAVSQNQVVQNSWVFLSATFDSVNSELRLYVNGDVVPTSRAKHYGIVGGAPNSDQHFAVGRLKLGLYTPADIFAGQIAYVSAVPGVLSSQQRSDLYHGRKPS